MYLKYQDKTISDAVEEIIKLIAESDDAVYIKKLESILTDLVKKNVAKALSDLDPLNLGGIND